MSSRQCPTCGGKVRRGVQGHDRSCPARRAERPGQGRARAGGLTRGPLTVAERPAEDSVFGTDSDAAEWVAYVGLDGRYAYVVGVGWHRWTGKVWQPVHAHAVRSDVRLAFQRVYDRQCLVTPRPDADKVRRLLDINWSLRLVASVREVVTRQAADLRGGGE